MIRYVFAQPLIGGMSIGFERSFGCPPIAIITAGIKNDLHYIKYMNEDRKLNIPVIYMDSEYKNFQSENDEALYNKIIKNIDVFAHVAVCSGLSQMNSCNSGSKARGCANNDQNQNMYNLTSLGMRMSAKVVVFENAVGAYTSIGEGTVNHLRSIADSFNYTTHLVKTDTLLHGIPQSRKRTFISFYKDSNPPVFKYEKKGFKELSSYLREISTESHMNDYIVEPEEVLSGLYEFILSKTNSSTLLEAIDKVGVGNKETWTVAQLTEVIGWDLAIEYLTDKSKEENDEIKLKKILKTVGEVEHYKKKKLAGLSFWDNTPILANRGKFTNAIVGKSLANMINPNEEKPYNIRQILHLMGMPDDFNMIEPKKNWNHICQNVPVKTSEYVSMQIKEYLMSQLPISNLTFVKQDNIKQQIDTKELSQKISDW